MYYLFLLGLFIGVASGSSHCDYVFDSVPEGSFSVVQSSKTCKDILHDEWRSLPKCDEKLLEVSLFTSTLFPKKNDFIPSIRLNMSAIVLEPAQSIFFFYSCLHAPDQSDNYCHDKEIQVKKYGELVEPCRGFQLSDSMAKFRADVSCFRIYGLSQYIATVVVLPQRCRTEIFLTLPLDYHFDPRIHHAFDPNDPRGVAYDQWSPLLFVDTIPNEGIWIRYERPPDMAKILEVSLNLYTKTGDKTKLIKKAIVKANSTGMKVVNLEKGDYLVVGYVKRHDCELHCNTKDGCQVCHHTMLNFTLSENKFTTAWRRVRPFVNAAKSSMAILIVIFALLCLAAIALTVYIKFIRPKIFSRRPAQQFELQEAPKILIIYSDDTETHSEAVAQLARFLASNANAEVHLDQFDLCDPNVRPSVWLQQNIESCNRVIVVFSEACQHLMSGRQMRQRRHYPDMFNSALYLVITAVSRITNTAPMLTHQSNGHSNGRTSTNGRTTTLNGHTSAPGSLSKFIVARFDYSAPSVIPDFFNLARCRAFVIPSELKLLVAHLHNVDATGNNVEYQVETGHLDSAIVAHKQFVQGNSRWLEERFMSQEEIESARLQSPDEIPERQITKEDLNEMGQKLGFIVPEDSDDEPEPTSDLNHTSHLSQPEESPLIHPDQIADSDDES